MGQRYATIIDDLIKKGIQLPLMCLKIKLSITPMSISASHLWGGRGGGGGGGEGSGVHNLTLVGL